MRMFFCGVLAVLLAGVGAGKARGAADVSVRWYGQSFVYVTTSTGTRIAIDPFGTDLVTYLFPDHLAADVVLVSNETDDHAAADRLFGSPLVFRAATGIGLNRACGLIFQGVETFKDDQHGRVAGGNTVYCFEVDGVKFAHLGLLGHPLSSAQRDAIGRVDVLFLPVGLPLLDRPVLDKIAADLQARIVVPVNYQTSYTGDMNLKPLSSYLDNQALPVNQMPDNGFTVSRESLPAKPTVYVLKGP